MPKTQSVTVQAQVPARLSQQMQLLVHEGWFGSVEEVMVDALRRFMETRQAAQMEQHIWEDVEWGLHGAD